jgi:hypothetical protein
MDRLRIKLGDAFTPVQAAGLAKYLVERKLQSHYDEDFDARRNGSRVADGDARMVGANVDYGGEWVRPDGRVVTPPSVQSSMTGAVLPTSQLLGPPALHASTGWMLGGAGVFEIAVSAYLLACGIAVFRRSPTAGEAHVRFVWLKFFVIAASIVIVYRFMTELWAEVDMIRAASRAAGQNARLAADVASSWASVIGAFIGEMIYPIAALLMVRTASSRAYFASLGGEVAALTPDFRRRAWRSVAWIDRPAGRVAAGIVAGVAALVAVGHLAAGAARGSSGGWTGAIVWAVLCAAVAGVAAIPALRAREAEDA